MNEHTNIDSLEFNKAIHERARLIILTYLASTTSSKVLFTELKDKLELTSGNLSVQLRNLEKVGYINIDKKIVGNRPETTVILTKEGLKNFKEYLLMMESIINRVKTNQEEDEKND
ncbi:MAG: transcriptional regulator [Clostridiales bacterium]|nr:transcriptional regulator [Clostridiales bacterium]